MFLQSCGCKVFVSILFQTCSLNDIVSVLFHHSHGMHCLWSLFMLFISCDHVYVQLGTSRFSCQLPEPFFIFSVTYRPDDTDSESTFEPTDEVVKRNILVPYGTNWASENEVDCLSELCISCYQNVLQIKISW